MRLFFSSDDVLETVVFTIKARRKEEESLGSPHVVLERDAAAVKLK